MISELLYAEYVQHASLDPFRMQLLVDNAKAGRVVGARGQTITMLKSKSGVVHINMSKDPEVITAVFSPLNVSFLDLCGSGSNVSTGAVVRAAAAGDIGGGLPDVHQKVPVHPS
jgi:hypothetical protein